MGGLLNIFKVNRTNNYYDHPDFENSAYGDGHIIGETIKLNGLSWFESLKSDLNNFKNGLSEITDLDIIKEIEAASSAYTL